MKRMIASLLARLRLPPLTRGRDWLVLLGTFLLWGGILLARPLVVEPRCKARPELCRAETVLTLDRPALRNESLRADQLSDLIQYIAGGAAAAVPALWHAGRAIAGAMSPAAAGAAFLSDLLVFGQTAAANGIMTELIHWISQRPRPYVYASPTQSENPADYTSFYSGHTSFAATATLALLITLFARGVPLPFLVPVALASLSLTASTAAFRVLAGRHFLTDVLAGGIAGLLIALFIAHRFRDPQRIPLSPRS
jgi:membrane-associated phospholipid phosphatase